MKIITRFFITFIITALLLANAVYADDLQDSIYNNPQKLKEFYDLLDHAIMMKVDCPISLVNKDDRLIDDDNTLVKPYIKNGRLLVPARFITEASGASIMWNGKNSTVSIDINGKAYLIDLKKALLSMDGKNIKMDVVPEILNGRLFLPIRVIAEQVLDKEVYYNNRIVLISDKGKTINPKYADELTKHYAQFFEDRILLNMIAPNGYQGIINMEGKYVVEPKYNHIDEFFDGTASVLVLDNGTEKWGIIDSTGKEIIKPFSESPIFYSEGLADVKVNDKFGFIDLEGNFVIEPKYEFSYGFQNSLAVVESDGKYGYINKNGDFEIEPQFESADSFYGDYASVSKDVGGKELFGIIDRKGNFVVEPKFDHIEGYRQTEEGVFFSARQGDWENGLWGTININGDWVIEPKFDDMLGIDSYDDYLSVEVNGKYGIIDLEGNYLISPMSDEYIFLYSPDDMNVYCEDGKYGYVDGKGEVIISPQFEDADLFFNDLARIKVNGKYGFIDKTGKIKIEPIYEEAKYFLYGLARVRMDGLYNFINKKGKLMFFSKAS
ncbi:WG repeat-containing protein [Acetivibrio cellulolyticus]|uniref:WG repeat-containing protein n=1 Tax=Acetivibrio cellulolyticus TaxID=35830 RepID=UPI0001E2F062|nr:WG repeat-containing protein [Acetivibrio cellulolyticus]